MMELEKDKNKKELDVDKFLDDLDDEMDAINGTVSGCIVTRAILWN